MNPLSGFFCACCWRQMDSPHLSGRASLNPPQPPIELVRLHPSVSALSRCLCPKKKPGHRSGGRAESRRSPGDHSNCLGLNASRRMRDIIVLLIYTVFVDKLSVLTAAHAGAFGVPVADTSPRAPCVTLLSLCEPGPSNAISITRPPPCWTGPQAGRRLAARRRVAGDGCRERRRSRLAGARVERKREGFLCALRISGVFVGHADLDAAVARAHCGDAPHRRVTKPSKRKGPDGASLFSA